MDPIQSQVEPKELSKVLMSLANSPSTRDHFFLYRKVTYKFWLMLFSILYIPISSYLKSSLVKVRQFQNEFMNTNEKLSAFLPYVGRAEILTIFCSYFGKNNDFINSFWNWLTSITFFCSRTYLEMIRFMYFHILRNIW